MLPLGVAVHQAQVRLTRLQRDTLRALETFANIVDERDPSTYRHSLRVAAYVDQLARALHLPFSDIDRLRWAGRLHDLGKVAVDSSVLRKPGRLDGEEWAAVRRHPRLSARLLQRFEFVATQARAVELHHERVDGHGYYGIRDEDLPLAAHFLIVADSFDAMTTDRPYREGLSKEEALAEVERNLGTQFHPVVGKAFVAVQRGLDPFSVLTPEEAAQVRTAHAAYRVGVVPGRSLRDRPELLALGGIVLALVGLAFGETWIAAVGGAIAAAGAVLYVVARARAERLVDSLRGALHGGEREGLLRDLVSRLSRSWPVEWYAFVSWAPDGLGGRIEREHGDGGPDEATIVSWLIRGAESGADLLLASAADVPGDRVTLALPIRRETSQLVGFIALQSARVPPRPVELALVETVDEIGLALADRPAKSQHPAEAPDALTV
jgi:putative nucleotidyltransferase with HDIG domain